MSGGMAGTPQASSNWIGPIHDDPNVILAATEALGARIVQVRAAIGRIIFGQDEVIDQTLITLLSGGHVLLVGVPGLGKSRLVETLGVVLGMATKRIQFTPDLMPADIVGSEVLDETEGRRAFRFVPGPVFCQLLMADEINRASPRTQSALLQAMQEQRVAIGGVEHVLPRPFHVLATQNPIEQEGTYPLPEAQLDRFLFDIRVGYPKEDEEISILRNTTGKREERLGTILGAHELIELQRLTREIAAADSVLRYAATLVRATRPDDARAPELVKKYVRWGAGPRAGQSLILGAKAHALLAGRLAVSPSDVKRVAMPVLRHRVLPNFAAEAEGISVERIIDDLLVRIDPPRSDIHV
jgi:MoxR-like ATPase